jgi:hypothetical protein
MAFGKVDEILEKVEEKIKKIRSSHINSRDSNREKYAYAERKLAELEVLELDEDRLSKIEKIRNSIISKKAADIRRIFSDLDSIAFGETKRYSKAFGELEDYPEFFEMESSHYDEGFSKKRDGARAELERRTRKGELSRGIQSARELLGKKEYAKVRLMVEPLSLSKYKEVINPYYQQQLDYLQRELEKERVRQERRCQVELERQNKHKRLVEEIEGDGAVATRALETMESCSVISLKHLQSLDELERAYQDAKKDLPSGYLERKARLAFRFKEKIDLQIEMIERQGYGYEHLSKKQRKKVEPYLHLIEQFFPNT